MAPRISESLAKAREHLLSLSSEAGVWEGYLSSSALSTATAIVALCQVDSGLHEKQIRAGAQWLITHANEDGGWGDTCKSRSNLSTTLLCWSALRLLGHPTAAADAYLQHHVGSLEPKKLAAAVIHRYGKDKTFSVPILMHCAICGTLGPEGWQLVLPLPFELAAMPRHWFGRIGLPVVSYALPALIAIGFARYEKQPPARWNPLRRLRSWAWARVSPLLHQLQPSSGGYLEATPLTSFVTMALCAANQKNHACIPKAVHFLITSMREDGSWPIDTNLATWGTTLAVKALRTLPSSTQTWLLQQQSTAQHPFTLAAAGAWAWTDLPGGVPDADDTSGALVALHLQRSAALPAAKAGLRWLCDLQNRDGGIPTFCRGWGTLPFDRSTPEITAHALSAFWLWQPSVPPELQKELLRRTRSALTYLKRTQRPDGSWSPLWFGNEHTPSEENPVYGTAMVTSYLSSTPTLRELARPLLQRAVTYLKSSQHPSGGWGGGASAPPTVEETAVTITALVRAGEAASLQPALEWLLTTTQEGTHFPTAPIGLYFARLWYHERLYPIVWTTQALQEYVDNEH